MNNYTSAFKFSLTTSNLLSSYRQKRCTVTIEKPPALHVQPLYNQLERMLCRQILFKK